MTNEKVADVNSVPRKKWQEEIGDLIGGRIRDEVREAMAASFQVLSIRPGNFILFRGQGWIDSPPRLQGALDAIATHMGKENAGQSSVLVMAGGEGLEVFDEDMMRAHGWQKVGVPSYLEGSENRVWRAADGSWWRPFGGRMVAAAPPPHLLNDSHALEAILSILTDLHGRDDAVISAPRARGVIDAITGILKNTGRSVVDPPEARPETDHG